MATLYANKIRKNDNNFGVHDASDYHNLRVDYKNSHSQKGDFDPDLSHKNIYYIFNPDIGKSVKVDSPTEEHILKIRDWQKETANSLKPKHSRKKTIDRNDDIQNSKKALIKWIQGVKTTEEEKKLYTEVLDQLETNLKSSNPANFKHSILKQFEGVAEHLKSDGVKISRYNDKRKRLQKLISIDFERDDKRTINNSTRQTEYLFKIPDPNNLKWSDEQMLCIVKDFKKYFEDYDALYVAIHHDENPDNPHLHFTMSNLNKKTKKYDIVQAEINAVRTWQIENNIEPDPVLDIAKTNMNEEQRSHFGTLWQDFMFDIANRQKPTPVHNNEKVLDNSFKKRTEEEKKKANHKYEQNKPIAKRQHNRQRKIQNEVNSQIKQYKKIRKNIENSEQEQKEIIEKAELARSKAKEILVEADREIKQFQEQSHSFLEVIMSIIGSLKDIFTGKNPNEAHRNYKHQCEKLTYEHDWTQEQVSRIRNVRPSEYEKVFDVGNEVANDKLVSMKEKLEMAKKIIDETEVSQGPGLKTKPK